MSMKCVHAHQKIPVIEGWGNPNHILNVINKTRENNQKDGKSN
jgi:hypothetical protein